MTSKVQDWLTSQAERSPESTAVVFHGNATTYETLDRTSNRLARALKAAGCRRGDRVALLLPKSPDALMAMFGSVKADCIYVPIDTLSPAARILRILEACECRCVLAERSTAPLLNELMRIGDPADFPCVGWMDGGADLEAPVANQFRRNEVESLYGNHSNRIFLRLAILSNSGEERHAVMTY